MTAKQPGASRGFPRVETRKPCPMCGHTRYYVYSGQCLACAAKKRAKAIKEGLRERGFCVSEKPIDIEKVQKKEREAMSHVRYD